jgi:tRNA pseudouridine55 synthase
MSELCRSRQKDFAVGGVNCLEFDDLAKGEEVWGPKVADMLAKWSGAPQPPKSDQPDQKEKSPKKSKSPEVSPVKGKSKSRSASPSSKGEKRRRSESPAGPRKAAALESKETPSKPSVKGRSDDEKSWNGFDD